jgi:hypothetical protein
MPRRAWIRAALLLVAVLGVVGVVLGAMLKKDPEFYTRPAVFAAKPDDPTVASDAQTRLDDLRTKVFSDDEWAATFTADQLNAFFREDPAMNDLIGPRLGGLTAPRVDVDGDRLRVAARYGSGFWSTVVSAEFRAWVIADEQPNLFAVEVVSFRAGSLPLPKRQLMDKLTTFAVGNATGVTWFHRGNNPVAVCKWLHTQSRPSTLLQALSFEDGKITLAGRNLTSR